jgi:serine/threonine protein phosphatase PrpC
MRASLQWRTQAGTITADNRDACAHLEQTHASLYLIADGSSSHPLSGELANALLARLVTDFSQLQLARMNAGHTAEALRQIIATSHQALRDEYPRAACSYLILCLFADTAFSIHEGDCCLGLIEQTGGINWLSSAHCAANWQGNLTHAEIAQDASRHRLTRCFSARRVSNPEIKYWPLAPHQHWLLASDGFWACLSDQEQLTFLRNGNLDSPPRMTTSVA